MALLPAVASIPISSEIKRKEIEISPSYNGILSLKHGRWVRNPWNAHRTSVSPQTNTKLLLQQQQDEGNIDTRDGRIRMLGSKNLHVCSVLLGCLNSLCHECISLKCNNTQLYAVLYLNRRSNHTQYQTFDINPYPTAFPYGNGMVLHFYQQQESSTTKTVHKVINKGLKTYV